VRVQVGSSYDEIGVTFDEPRRQQKTDIRLGRVELKTKPPMFVHYRLCRRNLVPCPELREILATALPVAHFSVPAHSTMAKDEPQHDDSDDDANDSSKDEAQSLKDEGVDDDDDQPNADVDAEDEEEDEEAESKQKKPRKIHKLSMTTTQNFNEKLRKRGVLYVARIPPRMSPTKLKSLLGQFGPIIRVYLVPEDQSAVLANRLFIILLENLQAQEDREIFSSDPHTSGTVGAL
jgi:hypothetical protein